MKGTFLSFASRYVVAILAGLGLLAAHSMVVGGVLSIFVPCNISPWELGKVAFWPLLLVSVLLPSGGHQGFVQCVTATVALVLLGWLGQGMGFGGVWFVVVWMVVLAGVLSVVAPENTSPWWVLCLFVLAVGFGVLTFFPCGWGPFLDPSDVAAMAIIPF